jgi:CubicO group peptidase (beta-lactamase class C family)
VRLLRPETVDEALRPQAAGPDVLLGHDVTWGLGPQLEGAQFGMGGIGGSLAYADRERRLAFAYVTCALGGHERAEAVERALLEAL